ncbi:MAG: NUDIX domain-containing protein [Patescibacteria group bacterium]
MNIPPQAKKVFTGKIFDVYQWEQKLFDGSSETFEMLKRPNTLQVIATIGDTIVIAMDEQPGRPPRPTLLGGRQEPDETPLEGAKRELLEESGLASSDWEEFTCIQPVGKIEWNVYTFIARDCKKIQNPQLDPGEKIDLQYLSFDECIATILSESFWGREMETLVLTMKLNGTLEEFRKRIFKRTE